MVKRKEKSMLDKFEMALPNLKDSFSLGIILSVTAIVLNTFIAFVNLEYQTSVRNLVTVFLIETGSIFIAALFFFKVVKKYTTPRSLKPSILLTISLTFAFFILYEYLSQCMNPTEFMAYTIIHFVIAFAGLYGLNLFNGVHTKKR